jgi:hypothetical protein
MLRAYDKSGPRKLKVRVDLNKKMPIVCFLPFSEDFKRMFGLAREQASMEQR